MSALRRFASLSSLWALLLGGGGCVVENTAHCFYKEAGFCAAAYVGRDYCSVCAAELDGCVAAPPAAGCAAAQATASSGEVTTSTASTAEATTSGEGSTTVETTSSSTSEPTTTTTGTTTTGTTTPETTADTTTTEATTGGDTTGDDTTEDPTGEALCGDGVIDAPEVCDGAALGGATCAQKDPWGGGTLKCAVDCQSLDYTGCCLGAGTKCMAANDKCCPGSKCKLDGLLSYSCQP